MYYKKIRTDHAVIEFHNNWLGMETVIVNGKEVSQKSSLLGTNHYFVVSDKGRDIAFTLTTKLGPAGQVYFDLRKDGELIEENVLVNFGTKGKHEPNEFKTKGIQLLKEYEIKLAIEALKKGLAFDKKDPEIYFHLACCYSIEENAEEGFECIKQAVSLNLNDKEMILNHEMLAYLRLQDAFEDFLNSDFQTYTINTKKS